LSLTRPGFAILSPAAAERGTAIGISLFTEGRGWYG
jgi:hypothetical protein